jgi:dienelactone hydrolase
MNQNHANTCHHGVPWVLVALAFAFMGACGGSGLDPLAEPSYLEEAYRTEVENDVQYGTALDENGQAQALLLDLHQPTDDDEDRRPAIVWLHGGSFQAGHKGEMTEFAHRFAQRGYVSAAANYRLRENQVFDYTVEDDVIGQEAKRDAQHDAQAAVRWLRANASTLRVDPDRIFIAGYSSGGTTALRVAAHASDPGESGNPGHSSSVNAVVAISGSLDPGTLEAGSGPTLMIHGESDTKVPFAQIQAACSGVSSCQLVPIPLAPHNMITPSRESIITAAATFLNAQATAN